MRGMRQILATACLMTLVTVPAQAESIAAHLAGQNEVPPVETRARGQAVVSINDDRTLSFRVAVANIENVTQAHIHCGPADANGPVVAFLFGLVSGGVNLNGILAEGTIDAADVIARPDSAACPAGVGDLDDLVAQIESGNAYVNVHTTQHPGGEIRGQLDRPATSSREASGRVRR